MTLYMAVTGDEYEIPLYITDSAKALAAWAGIKVSTVHSSVCRNKDKPPLPADGTKCKYRLRKVFVEDDEK